MSQARSRRPRDARRSLRAAAAASALAATLTAGEVHALDWEGELRLQMNDGGDKIGTVQYSDGSNSDLKAGTYFTIAGGFAVIPVRMAEHALEVGTRIGFASWSTGPDNTEDRLKLARFPWEIAAYYRFDWPGSRLSLRAGGGMVYQFISGLGGSGSLSNIDVDIDNALGWKLETIVAYEVLALGVGFTSIQYDVSGTNVRLNASSFGASLSVIFPPVNAGAPAAKPASARAETNLAAR